jgi:prenylcysteine oxidase / farnesylcysteine lyase
VILAAPYRESLEIDPKPDTALEITEYKTVHVTLVSTTASSPNKEYFANDTNIPTSILTSFQGARSGRTEPPFYTLSYLGQLSPESDEHLVKIFSKRRLSAKWLGKLFDGQIGWVLRKEVASPVPLYMRK